MTCIQVKIMSISQKQLVANKKNALKGGVKTDEGKESVRFNARKHGILANIIAEYEKDFFNDFLDELFEELAPSSVIENFLVERIALHYLKLFRIRKAEAEHIKSCLNPPKFINSDFDDIFAVEGGYSPAIDKDDVRYLLEVYAKYEVTTENRLYRAIHELRVLKEHTQSLP